MEIWVGYGPGLCLAVLVPLRAGWRQGRVKGPEAAHPVAALLLFVCLFVYFAFGHKVSLCSPS